MSCHTSPKALRRTAVATLAFWESRWRGLRPHAWPVRQVARTARSVGGLLLVLLLTPVVRPAEGEAADAPGTKPERVAARPLAGSRAFLPRAFFKVAPESVEDLAVIEERVKRLVAQLSPAVVSVAVGNGAGSGAIISADGLVLTAAHVCGAPNRTVIFTLPNGKTARGKTLGTNHEMDAGLMKIAGAGPWPHVEIGEPGQTQLGDWVLALGHPGGFDPQRPVVARLGRIIRIGSDLVQSDCTLISGDSGGPLLDMSGRVVGIHSRISGSTKENFHVPISAYYGKEHWERLARGESWGERRPMPRPFVGVTAVDDPEGCRVEQLDENGPASKAGLKPGDLITKISGQPIKEAGEFRQAVGRLKPGDRVRIEIRRGEVRKSFEVQVEGRGGRGRGRFGP